MSLAAALLYRSGGKALRIGWRDGRKHPSPNAGWAEAAMAGALDVRLGGPSSYGGVVSPKALLGESERLLTPTTVRQSIRVMLLTSWLAICLAIPCRALIARLTEAGRGESEQNAMDRTKYPVLPPGFPFAIIRSSVVTNDTADVSGRPNGHPAWSWPRTG